MQKYRADESTPQADGAVLWHARWIGGPTLAKVNNCRLEKLHGEPRRTVYITGEPDTAFSIPAVCKYAIPNAICAAAMTDSFTWNDT